MNAAARTIISLAFFSTTAAFAADLEIMHGYQSNPYKLSDDTHGSRLISAGITHQEIFKLPKKREFRLSAEAKHDRYLDVNEGDATLVKLRGRLVNRYRFGDRSASLLLTGDAGTRRAAYIDQRTSSPLQTSRGEDIRERFSYNFFKSSAEFTFRWNSQLSTGILMAVERRDYINDYESLGIEALDYTELSVQPTLRYRTENTYSRAYVFARERFYDNRMVDDINGRNIIGSELQFSLNGFGLSHQRDITENWTVGAFLSGYKVQDNGVGYSNSDAISTSLNSEYQFANSHSLDLDGKCTRRANAYARTLDSADIDIGRQREGCELITAYEQPVKSENDRLKLRVEIKGSWEENTESIRSYDQWAISVGFNYHW
ncbi:MAG: hypothetical protein ACI9E4_000445 [Pseudohongiellaceae bacterium]|jgi:hypothetical protein